MAEIVTRTRYNVTCTYVDHFLLLNFLQVRHISWDTHQTPLKQSGHHKYHLN